MASCFRPLIYAVIALVALPVMATARDAHEHWDYLTSGNPPHWAPYYEAHARIRLGREQRLPNGVSWRMFLDLETGLAMPRVTWMPSRRRLATANRLLDMIQGGDMLRASEQVRIVELQNDVVRQIGGPLLGLKDTLEQTDVGLTYVGSRFMSLMEAMLVHPSGIQGQVIQYGLTFDLDSEKTAEVTACPRSKRPYGYSDDDDPDAFLFQYGEWLEFCDRTTYREFIAVVKEIAERSTRRLPPQEPTDMGRCQLSPDEPLIHERREYILYLTFEGLAVQVVAKGCPIKRTADNLVIVPYRRLERFMRPGPLKDELLK